MVNRGAWNKELNLGRRRPNGCFMLVHRLRRWTNMKPATSDSCRFPSQSMFADIMYSRTSGYARSGGGLSNTPAVMSRLSRLETMSRNNTSSINLQHKNRI